MNEMFEEDPCNRRMFDFLMSKTSETRHLDFKAKIDIYKKSPCIKKMMKDVYAFCNSGGGYMLTGIRENDRKDKSIKGTLIKTGLDDRIDSATLQEKINSNLDEGIEINYQEYPQTFDGEERWFGLLYFPPSTKIMVSKNGVRYRDEDGSWATAVEKGITYIRRGTQSVPAEEYEKELIKERVKDLTYRLSILSGKPDYVTEKLYTNFFKIKKMPDTVYCADTNCESHTDINGMLTEFRLGLTYRLFKGQVVTLVNTSNEKYAPILNHDNVRKDPVQDWLGDKDRKNIIISLLHRELLQCGRKSGMLYDARSRRMYYPIEGSDKRTVDWKPRHVSRQSRQVVKRIYNKQAYFHRAVRASIIDINADLYLMLNTTAVITDDGRNGIQRGPDVGPLITKELHRSYNNTELNLVLFWAYKLVTETDYIDKLGLRISDEPVQITVPVGISDDTPPTDFKQLMVELAKDDPLDEDPDGSESGIEGYPYDL